MDHKDTEWIKEIIEDRKDAHKYLVGRKSKVYEAFLTMEKATYSAGALEKKVKELIAIGISIVINCQPCLEWHIKQAVDAGAKDDEILEAIEVGMEMGGGPATVTARFALKVLEYYTAKDTTRGHKR